MLKDEDYALAKDATKGLFVLAEELRLYPLYMALLDIYEDLENEDYKSAYDNYQKMMTVYKNIRSVFHV